MNVSLVLCVAFLPLSTVFTVTLKFLKIDKAQEDLTFHSTETKIG